MSYPYDNENENDETDEEEPTFIDPNDLIIIEENDWEPPQKFVLIYAKQLGFDLKNYREESISVAYKYLSQNIPEDYRKAFTKKNPQLLYIDTKTNEIHLQTDIEEQAVIEYNEMINYLKKQKAKENKILNNFKKNKAKDSRIKNKDIGHYEINNNNFNNIPINNNINNNIINSNNSKGNNDDLLFDSVESQNKIKGNKKYNHQNSDILIQYSPNHDEEDNSQDKIDKNSYYDEDALNHPKILNDDEDDSLNHPRILNDDESGSEKQSSTKKIKSKMNEMLNNGLSNSSSDNKIQHKNKLINEKEKYLMDKNNEIVEYKFLLNRQLQTYFDIVKKRIKKENKNKLESEKLNLKNELFKSKLENYEKELQKENNELLNDFKETIKTINSNNNDNINDSINENNQKIIKNLLKKKEKLKEKIESEKNKKKEMLKERKQKLSFRIDEIKEQINKQNRQKKDNIDKKYQLNVNKIERKLNDDLCYSKNTILNNYKKNNLQKYNENNEYNIKNILNEYQSNLEYTFELEKLDFKKKLEEEKNQELELYKQELYEKSRNEITNYKQKLENLSQNKINKESKEQYFINNNNLDEINDNLSKKIQLTLNVLLERDINEYKMKLLHFIKYENNDNNTIKEKMEEYFNNLINEYKIKINKLKLLYNSTEKDYKINEKLINYYIDILRFIIDIIINKPIPEFDDSNCINQFNSNDEYDINQMYLFGREKIKQYQIEINSSENINRYPYLDFYLKKYHIIDNKEDLQSSLKLNFESSQQPFRYFKKISNTTDAQKLNNTQEINHPNNLNLNSFQNNLNNFNTMPNCINNDNQNKINYLPQDIISLLKSDELDMYNKIVKFMNNEIYELYEEYLHINNKQSIQENKNENNNKNNNEQNIERIKLQKLYLDKDTSFQLLKNTVEETFNFILQNSQRSDIFREKFQFIINHIEEYKSKFNFQKIADNQINTSNNNSSSKYNNVNFYSMHEQNDVNRDNNYIYINNNDSIDLYNMKNGNKNDNYINFRFRNSPDYIK